VGYLLPQGLEFDVAVVPDISEFSSHDPIHLNGLYVAVSRPRHAILVGCSRARVDHKIVQQLCDRGDLSPVSLPSVEMTDELVAARPRFGRV
jgi:hypothetical protein